MYALRKDEVSVLKQMRRENEAAVAAQRELELNRAVERKKLVRDQQKEASARKLAEQSVASHKMKDTRDSRRDELDEDSIVHLQAYSSLAEEEERLIKSLQKWQSVQEEAFEQLDSVLGKSRGASRGGSNLGSRVGSRPVSRQLGAGSRQGGMSPAAAYTPRAQPPAAQEAVAE